MQLHLSNKYVIDKNIIYNDYLTVRHPQLME